MVLALPRLLVLSKNQVNSDIQKFNGIESSLSKVHKALVKEHSERPEVI